MAAEAAGDYALTVYESGGGGREREFLAVSNPSRSGLQRRARPPSETRPTPTLLTFIAGKWSRDCAAYSPTGILDVGRFRELTPLGRS